LTAGELYTQSPIE